MRHARAPCGGCVRWHSTRGMRRGMRDADLRGMKPILLLAFLAVGPALADQFPVIRPASDPVVAAVAPAGSESASVDSLLAARDDEHLWLCGR